VTRSPLAHVCASATVLALATLFLANSIIVIPTVCITIFQTTLYVRKSLKPTVGYATLYGSQHGAIADSGGSGAGSGSGSVSPDPSALQWDGTPVLSNRSTVLGHWHTGCRRSSVLGEKWMHTRLRRFLARCRM